jgi:hypothetical protein
MKLADFIKEHKRLVKLLQTGTKKQRVKEATGQAKELKDMIKKHTQK